jgi:hypothetical protein
MLTNLRLMWSLASLYKEEAPKTYKIKNQG